MPGPQGLKRVGTITTPPPRRIATGDPTRMSPYEGGLGTNHYGCIDTPLGCTTLRGAAAAKGKKIMQSNLHERILNWRF